MKRKKRNKKTKNNKVTPKYSILIIIATLFMGIGYAQVNDVKLSISGTGEAVIPKEVFITDVTYVENENTEIGNSKINYAIESTLSSYIELENDINSTIQYKISVHNNSTDDYIFIGVITDKSGEELTEVLYSNTNIEYTLTDLQENVTTIAPGADMEFILTFHYKEDADISQNTLTSTLNFRFLPLPTLELSNEGETYTIDNIYPGYTQEYEFTVSNYNEQNINNVPMNYSFFDNVTSPFTAKIYNEDGEEVTGNITVDSDGITKTTNKYTLKLLWESSENIDYTQYENKEYQFNISLKAVPDYEKYLEYAIEKSFNTNINVAPFYFTATTETSAKMINDNATLSATVKNYNSDTEYNVFDTTYEISIANNDKFTVSTNGVEANNNVITITGNEAKENNFNIILTADTDNLNLTETLTLKIISKKPYYKEITFPITITLQPITVSFDANGGTMNATTISAYNGRPYGTLPTVTRSGYTFNGWFTAKTGGTKCTSTTSISATGNHTLYAQWTPNLLVDYVKVGDYVDYEIYYDNVTTNGAGSYAPSTDDEYKGWRVLSVEGSGDNRYVRLMTAGVPMTYRHPYSTSSSTVGSTSVTNLTTGFFSTTMNTSTATNNQFHRCGFKTSESATTYITSTSSLSTLFKGNAYTQLSGTTPVVKSVTKDDMDNYIAYVKNVDSYTSENGNYLYDIIPDDDLFTIPSSTSGSYAAYYLATVAETYYMWQVRFNAGIVYTYYEYGVRPVVSLKATTLKTGGSGTVSNPYTLGI